MKKLNLLYTLLLVSLLSCHEEHEMARPISVDPPIITPPMNSLVQSVTSGDETTLYSYDEYNRVVRSQYENEGRSEIEYLDGLVIQRLYHEDGTPDYFTTFEINEEGLVSHRTISNNADYSESREYNNERFLLKNTSVNDGSTFVSNHFYSNHNLDSTVYIRDGEVAYTYKYTYLDKPNSLDNVAYGRPYYGNTSQNLIKNWRGFRPDGSVFIQVSFAYTFDSKGRVATMTQVTNDAITTFTYSYY